MNTFLLLLGVLSLFCTINCTKHQLVVYWGQDSAGSLRLKLETKLSEFCLDYDYDIIPIAFLNVFFDTANKDKFPGINLANHCNTTFKGYPTLLNCTDIGHQITKCQQMGKKILISLGGAAGLYYFSSSSQATMFAERIWQLFLDGNSDVRPFRHAVLDGVDLDIEGGTTNYYADFVKTIRSLMAMDTSKKYYITGAPQCPYPDAIMGPGSDSQVLTTVAQEFDYLFVQFYNNWCSLDNEKPFNASITKWFEFSATTQSKYGKGPLIFIGLPASPAVRGYQKPSVVEAAYNKVADSPYFGGIMLWDASFDENNIIGGQHYSSVIKSFMNRATRSHITSCFGYTLTGWHIVVLLSALVVLTMVVAFVVVTVKKFRQSTVNSNSSNDIQKKQNINTKQYFHFI